MTWDPVWDNVFGSHPQVTRGCQLHGKVHSRFTVCEWLVAGIKPAGEAA